MVHPPGVKFANTCNQGYAYIQIIHKHTTQAVKEADSHSEANKAVYNHIQIIKVKYITVTFRIQIHSVAFKIQSFDIPRKSKKAIATTSRQVRR